MVVTGAAGRVLLALNTEGGTSDIFKRISESTGGVTSDVSSTISDVGRKLVGVDSMASGVVRKLAKGSTLSGVLKAASGGRAGVILLKGVLSSSRGGFSSFCGGMSRAASGDVISVRRVVPTLGTFGSTAKTTSGSIRDIASRVTGFNTTMLTRAKDTSLTRRSVVSLDGNVGNTFTDLSRCNVSRSTLRHAKC